MTTAETAETEERLAYAELAFKNGGDGAAALATARETLVGRDVPLPTGLEWRARRLAAAALEATGDYPGAIAELDSLVSEVPKDRDWIGMLMARDRCHRMTGDLVGTMRAGHEALAAVEREGLADTEEGIRLTVSVSGSHMHLGELHQTLRMCEQAAERAEAIGSDLALASAYWNASACHYRLGDLAASADLARAALASFEAIPDPRSQAMLRTNLALACMRMDPPDLDEAELHIARAEAEFGWSEASVVERAFLGSTAARLAYLRGDLARARRMAREGLSVTQDRAPRIAAGCHLTLGQVCVIEGDETEAREHFHRAIRLLASSGMDREIAQAWYELGGVLDAVGDIAAALDAYRRAAVSTGLVSPDRDLGSDPSLNG